MPIVLATQSPGEPEIFASVQGEGPSMGTPCTFIRLSRCNLACVWCDTAYTWHFTDDDRPHRDGETFDRKANQVTLEIADVAERILAIGQSRLIITGGEPLLQAGPLAELLELLPDMTVEVETNGTTTAPPRLDIMAAPAAGTHQHRPAPAKTSPVCASPAASQHPPHTAAANTAAPRRTHTRVPDDAVQAHPAQ